MKNILISIGIFICVSVLLAACEKKELLEYENDPRVYFAEDSVTYSFFLEKSYRQRDTIWMTVNVMGMPSDKDRAFRLSQIEADGVNAARPGIHYVDFDDPEVSAYLKVEAGKVSGSVPLIVLRDTSLARQEYRLEVELLPDENFSLGIATKLQMLFKISDIAVKPAYWDQSWKKIFGEWGSVKMKFIIDNLGLVEFPSKSFEVSEVDYYRTKINKCLNDYNATHDEELKEADGSKVVFPKQ